MLRPRTAVRFLSYLGLSWLVLAALYAGIPSFTRIDNGVDYSTRVLKSGAKLTRVYATNKNFVDPSAVDFSDSESRRNIALTFRIDKASHLLVICDTGSVPLTRLAETNTVESQNDPKTNLTLSRAPIVVSAPAGDTDGVNLPWFDTADAVLMFHLIHRDRAVLKLRAGYSQGGRKIELWSGGDNWTGPWASQADSPLISVTTDSETGLVTSACVPPISHSPSPSYFIRLTVFLILAPLTVSGLAIYMAIIFIIYAALNTFIRLFWIIALSLLVSWLYKGRPSPDDFMHLVIDDVAGIFRKLQTWFKKLFYKENGYLQPSIRDDEESNTGTEKES